MGQKRIPQDLRIRLKEALRNLEALTTANSSCPVAQEHKDAVRLYVDSWIKPALEEVIDFGEGHPKDYTGRYYAKEQGE